MSDQERDALGTRYRLRIRTLSPLHVGAGGADPPAGTVQMVSRTSSRMSPIGEKLIAASPRE